MDFNMLEGWILERWSLINVDSLLVVKAIKSSKSGSSTSRLLVERICSLLAIEWEVVVHHSFHEINQCADALANNGCLMPQGSSYDSCPTMCNSLYLSNNTWITTSRLVAL
jgi:ribonuclease HI